MQKRSDDFWRVTGAWFITFVWLLCGAGVMANDDPVKDAATNHYSYLGAGNPYLPLWEHLPDGEPRVFEDPDQPGKFRVYVIGSHDVRATSYCGPDTRAWSAAVDDLSTWRDEGPIFAYATSNQWDVMYAPDLVEVKGKDGTKVYYLYPHSRGVGREAMVAKGGRPTGPFTPLNLSADGSKTKPGSLLGFDPGVFIEYVTNRMDPDFETGFRAYGYWGFRSSSACELDPQTLYSLRPGTRAMGRFIPSRIFPGEDPCAFSFFEASSIRKIGNKYVLVYSGYSGSEYGLSRTTASLRYAYADAPLGPWKNGGVLVDARAVLPTEDGAKLQTTFAGHNTHGSIQLINDQYYVFYHRAPRGNGYARQAMVAPAKVEWDEKPVSEGGKVTIRGYDPYATDKVWGAKGSLGSEYRGVEVTSEGFHIYGLDPYRYYSAGYACYLSNQQSLQDSWDIWDNSMPLAHVQTGDIIGYKYFGFGGLAQDQKGLKAFAGARPGNHTALHLFLKPTTTNAFQLNIWLDGPWDNAIWKGKKMGEIHVPARAAQEVTDYTLDVAAAVERLKEKHAIFLVAGGAETGTLCEVVGLGFSSDKVKIMRPVPPLVRITVNGQVLQLPAHPVRSTDANGVTGLDVYAASSAIAADVPGLPQVAAASEDSVKVDVKQAETRNGTAVVKFNYRGVVKTYQVAFTAR